MVARKQAVLLPLGLSIGMSLGTAIGITTDNIGLWMPLGVSFGVCFGLLMSMTGENRKIKTTDEPPQDMDK